MTMRRIPPAALIEMAEERIEGASCAEIATRFNLAPWARGFTLSRFTVADRLRRLVPSTFHGATDVRPDRIRHS